MHAESIAIRDPQTGSTAEVLLSRGFNCHRFTAVVRGRPVEVLYAPPGFASGQERPSRGGIPLLFPFPGRIAGTTFRWQGREYPLEAGDGRGNAIHGFVMWRTWRVVEQSDSRVVGQFHAWRDDPSLKAHWPADFRLTASYALQANTLRAEYLVENPGDVPLPCGLGTHPYFRVPLAGGAADDCIVKLPVSARWELADMLPTGRRLEVDNAAALQAGTRFGDLAFDDVFSGLSFADGWCTASVHDPAAGVTVTQRFDRTFRECVVFTPPHREAICIEPYTCVPGAFDLAERGIDAGLRIVSPGESLRAVVEIEVT
jgi:aldose 1-epimerase